MSIASAARLHATHRKNENNFLNPPGGQCEWAYSPSTGAVGMREATTGERGVFRVCNTYDSMYGRAELVTDWVSVGDEKPRKGYYWTLQGSIWVSRKDIPGRAYKINEHGSKVEA